MSSRGLVELLDSHGLGGSRQVPASRPWPSVSRGVSRVPAYNGLSSAAGQGYLTLPPALTRGGVKSTPHSPVSRGTVHAKKNPGT